MNQPTAHRAIDLVVFDMAGTTIEEGSIVYDALRDAVTPLGADPSPAQLDAVKGMDKVSAIRILLGDAASDHDVETAFGTFTAELSRRYATDHPQPMPGAEDLLTELHARGIQVALTTGFTAAVAQGILDTIGWRVGQQIDALVTTDDVPAGRPAPFMIHLAMQRTGTTDVRRVVSVGDTIADVQSARNAGVRSVAVLSGDTSEQTLAAEGPDEILGSVAQLLTIAPLASGHPGA